MLLMPVLYMCVFFFLFFCHCVCEYSLALFVSFSPSRVQRKKGGGGGLISHSRRHTREINFTFTDFFFFIMRAPSERDASNENLR